MFSGTWRWPHVFASSSDCLIQLAGYFPQYLCEKPPRKILHGIPWRIRTSISMEFHGNFSIDFHGKYLHGGLGHFPWNSMENIRTPISMEISASTFSMEDQDIFYGIPWKSSLQFHRNYSIDYSMDLQGVSWNSQELDI